MKEVPAALRNLVLATLEGSLLYVEELIKALIEQGVITLSSDDKS